jgi:hypothetical protein
MSAVGGSVQRQRNARFILSKSVMLCMLWHLYENAISTQSAEFSDAGLPYA